MERSRSPWRSCASAGSAGRTRIILTALYVASWGLFFLRDFNFLFTLAQLVLIAVFGVATYGLDWLIGRY
jgi:hypothetical protein